MASKINADTNGYSAEEEDSSEMVMLTSDGHGIDSRPRKATTSINSVPRLVVVDSASREHGNKVCIRNGD